MATPTSPVPLVDQRPPRLLEKKYIWVSLGACALVFLGAFESMAVTTIMPVISADLHGESLYALAFAGPLAAAVFGMVIAGNWSDRSGPVGPLIAAAITFVAGLVISGVATDMTVFLIGRLGQGLGNGAITVGLYVLVARALPPVLHPKMFAAFATAWVVPSLVGPVIAGYVTQIWSWHWVFLGVVALVFVSGAFIAPTLLRLPAVQHAAQRPRWEFGRWAWALLAAIAVLSLSVFGTAGPWGPAYAAIALVVGLIAVRPLLPAGTLRFKRGLPSIIGMRGLAAAAFFGAEVYIPYLLVGEYGFDPAQAGLALTGGAVTWAIGSNLQGRFGDRIPNVVFVRVGTIGIFTSIVILIAATAGAWSPVVIIAAWCLSGLTMGFLYPRFGVMTLAASSLANQGFNSAALTIADSFGSALALAIAGVLFGLVAAGSGAFIMVFAFAAAIGLAGIILGPRILVRA